MESPAISPKRISAALREYDVLEPWLSESHWDEGYWDAEAAAIAERLGPHPTFQSAHRAVAEVLASAFPGFERPGCFRPEYRTLLELIAARIVNGADSA